MTGTQISSGGWVARPVIGSMLQPTSLVTRPVCRVTLLVLLLAAAASAIVHGAGLDWLTGQAETERGVGILIALCLLYALVLALPFVPAIELGLLAMVLFGKPGAIVAWIATVVGLNIAYGVGRCIGSNLGEPGRKRLPAVVVRCLDRLTNSRFHRLVPLLTLALLLNLPGNTAVGGGGGISMAYGATGALAWPMFAVVVTVATSFVPLLFLLGLVGVERIVA